MCNWEGFRQPPGWIHFSEKDFGKGSSSFHSVKPAPDKCMYSLNPWHFHRGTGEHYHNCIRRHLQKLFQQFILCIWKLHIRAVVSLQILKMILSAYENNGIIITFCCFFHCFCAIRILFFQDFRCHTAVLAHRTAAIFQAVSLPVGLRIHMVKIICIISWHIIYLCISAKKHLDTKKWGDLIKSFDLSTSTAIRLDTVCIVPYHQNFSGLFLA